jgi:hypothetical protein
MIGPISRVFATLLSLFALSLFVLAGPVRAQDMLFSILIPPAQPAEATPAAAPPQAEATPPTPPQQTEAAPPPAAANPTTPAPAATTQPTPAAQSLSQAQLDQLVAPIALYPDPLLSQMLMASTYPLEVVEAAHWAQDPGHKSLTGDALTESLRNENWEPSVMALVPFPRVLGVMANQVQWMEQLGNAFLAQQADVMASVQRLRHAALAAGNLKTTPECHCIVQTSGDQIVILPSEPKLVCIPVYNPRYVYGSWWEPDYPPIVFPPPVGFVYAPGVWIGFPPPIEVAVFGPLWGWSWFDWGGGRVVVDNAVFGRFSPNHPAFAGGAWVHDPGHRRGVAYASAVAAARFGGAQRFSTVGAVRGAAAVTAGNFNGNRAAIGRFAAGPSFTGHSAMAARSFVGHGAPGAFHPGGFAHGTAQFSQSHAGAIHFSPGGHGVAQGRGPGGGPHGGPGGGPGGHHH